METEGDGEMTERSFHIQPKVDASYGGADWCVESSSKRFYRSLIIYNLHILWRHLSDKVV